MISTLEAEIRQETTRKHAEWLRQQRESAIEALAEIESQLPGLRAPHAATIASAQLRISEAETAVAEARAAMLIAQKAEHQAFAPVDAQANALREQIENHLVDPCITAALADLEQIESKLRDTPLSDGGDQRIDPAIFHTVNARLDWIQKTARPALTKLKYSPGDVAKLVSELMDDYLRVS